MAEVQLQGLLILLVIGAWHYFSSLELQVSVGGALFSASSGILHVQRYPNSSYDLVLNATLGQEFNLLVEAQKCEAEGLDSVCLEWPGGATLRMDYLFSEDTHCYSVSWDTSTKNADPHDCFDISENYWFGGAHMLDDQWSLGSRSIKMQPYLSADMVYNNYEHREAYGSVLERYWLSANGLSITVDDNVPLHVGMNQTHLCLKASSQGTTGYYNSNPGELTQLKYQICVGRNVRHIHDFRTRSHLDRPVGLPDETMLKYPIWSIAAKYNNHINQTNVLQFAYDIHDNGFRGSQIQIDEIFTGKHGDLEFDTMKFPNAKNMTNVMHDLGFRLTVSVTPFTNFDSIAFQEGTKLGYFIKDRTGKVPVLTDWWNGVGAILDPTNPDAVKWFDERLQILRDVGFDSFSFDAGEVNFLPNGFKTHQTLPHANHYSRVYAEMAANLSNNMASVRVGYQSQHLPMMVRVMPKESRWGGDHGLNSVIPTCLLFGIINYPFVLPDVIGGSAIINEFPEKELYIRWLQLTAFLPTMHFSIPPWQYDQETVLIAQSFIKLHAEYIHQHIMTAARETTINGAPIIRPLWWHDPDDQNTYSVSTQFLVGKNLLVAPILDMDKRSRTIYLPKGQWRDMLSKEIITGPQLLENFKVSLNETAYFEFVTMY